MAVQAREASGPALAERASSAMNSRRLMSASTAICLRRSLAHRQMLFAHTSLNDTRLVHSSDTDVLEYLVIDLAPPRLLDDDLLTAVNQRPEGRRLRLLRSIAAERKVHAGVCKISVTCSIRDPKFLDCGVRRNVRQHGVYLLGRHADLLSLGNELGRQHRLSGHVPSDHLVALVGPGGVSEATRE